jgi:CHAT domain-containing protein
LVEPLERDLRTKGIERLVYVPDGILRLVPLSVLSPDGQDFVTKHYVVVTNSGVRDVPQQVPGKPGKALLAGLSNPDGGVLSDPGIPRSYLAALRDKLVKRGTILPSGAEGQVPDIDALRGDAVFLAAAEKELVLQEVGQELSSIRRTIASDDPLLNQSFDKASFTERFKSGDYRIAHISTHGYFGHSADDSFIMAHDKILKIGELEEIMRSGASQRKSPVELVTFSACETAKGDDRAPLGFSGLAIKAKARNAMGALWPVDDEAARRFMEAYYAALGKNGGDNPKALQQAQLTLLKSEPMKHPSYWAPFILVGAW